MNHQRTNWPLSSKTCPLKSAALRRILHYAAEIDSGSKRSPLPGPDVDLLGLRSGLSGLRLGGHGLSVAVPGSNGPLSCQHVTPLREQDKLPPPG